MRLDISLNPDLKKRLLVFFEVGVSFLFLGLCFFVSSQHSRNISVDAYDEGVYLRRGLSFFSPNETFFVPDWAPLYSLWYGVVDFFTQNPLETYFLSSFLLVALIPAVFFLCLRRMGCGLFSSTLFGCMLLYSPYHVFMERKPNHFSVLFLLAVGLVASFFLKIWKTKWLFLWALFFAAAYVRPELFLFWAVSLGFVGFYLLQALKDRFSPESRRFFSGVIFCLVFHGLLFSLFNGLPINLGQENNKSFHVFKRKIQEIRAEHGHPVAADFNEEFKKNFGQAASISQAIALNPSGALNHFWLTLKSTLFRFHEGFLSSSLFWSWGFFKWVIWCFLLFQIPFLVFNNRRSLRLPFLWVIAGGAFLSELVACIFYGPLNQYMITALPFFFGGLAFAVNSFETRKVGLVLSVFLLGGAFVFNPSVADLLKQPLPDSHFLKKRPVNENIIEFLLQRQDLHGPVLSGGGFFWSFLPWAKNRGWDINVTPRERWGKDFPELLGKEKWGVIVATPEFEKILRARSDSSFFASYQSFLEAPEKQGFRVINTAQVPGRFFQRVTEPHP